ncbi:MAG: RNA helicase [Fushun polycipivirus 2]|nr:MAG: RNA helicase [Fushun polycipivirus 2]
MGHNSSKATPPHVRTITTYRIDKIDFDFMSEDSVNFIDHHYEYNEDRKYYELKDGFEWDIATIIHTQLCLAFDTKDIFINIVQINRVGEAEQLIKRFFQHFKVYDISPAELNEVISLFDIQDKLQGFFKCQHKMKSRRRAQLIHKVKSRLRFARRLEKKDKINGELTTPFLIWDAFQDLHVTEINYTDFVHIMKHFVLEEGDIANYLDCLVCSCSEGMCSEELFRELFDNSMYSVSEFTGSQYDYALLLSKGVEVTYTTDTSEDIAYDLTNLFEIIGEEDIDATELPEVKEVKKTLLPQNFRNVGNVKTRKPKKTALYHKIRREVNKQRKHLPYWRTEQDEKQMMISDDIRTQFEAMKRLRQSPRQIQYKLEDYATNDFLEHEISDVLQLFSLIDDKCYRNDPNSVGAKCPRAISTKLRKSYPFDELATLGERVKQLKEELKVKNLYRIQREVYLLFNMYFCGLEKHGDAKEAFNFVESKLLTWSKDGIAIPKKKALKMHPASIMYFLAQIKNRGLSTNFDTNICLNRREPLTDKDMSVEQIYEVVTQGTYYNPFKYPKFKTAIIQTSIKLNLLQDEAMRYRIRHEHERILKNTSNFALYVYEYYYPHGVTPTAEDVTENDDKPDDENKDEKTEDEEPSTSKDIPPPIQEDNSDSDSDSESVKSEDPVNPFDQNNQESRNFLAKKVKALWDSFTTKTSKLTSQIKDPIAGGLNQIYSQIISILTKMENFIDNCLAMVTGFFDKMMGGVAGPIVRAIDVLELLFYYLIYRNVGSRLIKVFALSQLFLKLGIWHIVTVGLEWFFETTIDFENWFKTRKENEEEQPSTSGATPTSDEGSVLDSVIGWFENCTSENLGKIATILVVGFSAVMGYKLSKDHCFNDLGKKVTEAARNWHYIGAGMFGMERVMKYASSIFKVIGDTLRAIFGKKRSEEAGLTEEQLKELNKEIVEVDLKLIHFSSYHGIEQIRTDLTKADEAQDIVRRALKIYSESKIRGDVYTIEMKRAIQNFRKSMIDVLNITQRVKNIIKPRETPFHVQFTSEPGNGKSTLINNLVSKIMKEFYPNMGYNAAAYARNSEDHFWPGYTGQPIVMVDEMYPVLDAETLVKWMIYISNLPVMVPMAELADKVTYFTSEWILSNTNVIYPYAAGVASLDAVYRRRHLLVEVEIDPRVKDTATGKFCKKLFSKFYPKQNTLDFPHLKFNLLKPVPQGTDGSAEYYMDGEILPNGLREPTQGLTYEQLFNSIKMRQACLKQEERNLRIYDQALDMLDVEEEWENIIDHYNKNGLTVKDKAFFSLNKPRTDITTDVLIEKEETRCEVAIEEEVITLTSEIKKTEEISVSTIVLDFEYITPDKKKNMARIEGKLVCEELEIRYLNEYKPSVVECIAAIKQSEFTPEKIILWLDQHKSIIPTVKDDGFVLEKGGAVPTSEDPDIVRLEQLIANLPPGKDSLKRRLEAKLQHMKFGNTKTEFRSPVSEFDEFITTKSFGFEVLKQANNEPFEQPDGIHAAAEIKSVEDWHDKYLSLNFPCYTPKVYIPICKEFQPFEPNQSDIIRYENAFCLTKREMRLPLFEVLEEANLGISYAFLENVEKHNGTYWFKWNKDLMRIVNYHRQKAKLQRFPNSPPNLMCDIFMYNSMIKFFDLNEMQKDYILERVRSMKRNCYSDLRSGREHVEKMRKFIEQRLEELVPEKVKKVLTMLKRILYAGGSLVALIFVMRQIGALFGGSAIETSKTYFKQSQIGKQIQGTSEVFPQHEDHLNALFKNLLKVRVIHNGTVNESNALGIVGNVFMLCKHTITWFLEDESFEYFDIEYRRSKQVDVDYHTARIYRYQVCEVNDRDIVFIKNETVSQFKNVIKFFYEEENLRKRKPTESRVSLIYNTVGTGWNRIDFPKTQYHDSWKDKIYGTNKKIEISNCYSYEFHAPQGSSGGLVIAQTNERQCVMGVQCFTDGTYSYSSTVTQEIIAKAIGELGTGITTDGPAFVKDGVSPTEELITSNCVIEGIIDDDKVLGTHLKSSYMKSPIAKHLEESKRIPAILNAFDSRVPVGNHPLKHSINKYGRDKMQILDNEILNHAAEQVTVYYKNRINTPIEILKMEQILKGIPKVDSMNVKTSPGIPWVYGRKLPGKKDYIRFDEEGDIEFLAQEVIDAFELLEFNMLNGNLPPMSAYEFPKDELRPIEKVMQMKTRSIGVLPMELNMLYRKYNGGIDGAIRTLANGNNPICIGINPDSLSWNEIYRNMKSKSDVGMDFDVGNWDGHLLHQLKQANNKVENELGITSQIDTEYYNRLFEKFTGEDHNLTPEEIRERIKILREAMSQSMTHGFINFLDIVIQVMRGLRSGFGGTGDENCRCHFILLVYIVNEIIFKKYGILLDIEEMFEYIVIYVYGDDVLIAIKDEFLNIVSYEEIIERYEYFGWPITSAEKVGELKPRPIEDLQFLKRKFKPTKIKEMTIMVGALDKEVIHDLTYWLRKGKNLSGQFQENLDNACFFMWAHGKEETEQFIRKINCALRKEALPQMTKTWKVIDSQMKYRIVNGQDQGLVRQNLDL